MLRGMTPSNDSLAALRRTLALTLALALGACGGGGSDSPAAAPAPAAAAPATAPAAGSRATCGLADFSAEALQRINAARAAGASCGSAGNFAATSALAWNAPLGQAALVHSDDMVTGNYFSHTGSDGSSAGQRAAAAGYAWSTWGENIAAGQPTVASVMAAWMGSPGHCANLMNPAFREVGLACVSGAAGNTYGSYWTMVLGASR